MCMEKDIAASCVVVGSGGVLEQFCQAVSLSLKKANLRLLPKRRRTLGSLCRAMCTFISLASH